MSEASFFRTVQAQIDRFERSPMLERIRARTMGLADYHRILFALFHQVRWSSSTFALAAAAMPQERWEPKAYLMRHAHEEALHWQWILNDLQSTDYQGPSPLTSSPTASAAAYVGYNHFIAATMPMGRLAIACVLEGIGGAFGARYGAQAAQILGLKPSQMQFFAGHGDTDVVHAQELHAVLRSAVQSDDEWQQWASVARIAGTLYAQIYFLEPATGDAP